MDASAIQGILQPNITAYWSSGNASVRLRTDVALFAMPRIDSSQALTTRIRWDASRACDNLKNRQSPIGNVKDGRSNDAGPHCD